MSGRILDSNIVIDLFRKDQKTIDKLKSIKIVYIPVIVLGELFYGANISNQLEKRLQQINDFSTKVGLLNCDKRTAEIYGEIKAQLKKEGKPIPENDVWIAAIAKQHHLTLLTNDKHFDYVKGIKTEKLK